MKAGSGFAQIRDSLTTEVGPERTHVVLLDYINEPVTKSEVLFKRVIWLKGQLTFDPFQGSRFWGFLSLFYWADVLGHMWKKPLAESAAFNEHVSFHVNMKVLRLMYKRLLFWPAESSALLLTGDVRQHGTGKYQMTDEEIRSCSVLSAVNPYIQNSCESHSLLTRSAVLMVKCVTRHHHTETCNFSLLTADKS